MNNLLKAYIFKYKSPRKEHKIYLYMLFNFKGRTWGKMSINHPDNRLLLEKMAKNTLSALAVYGLEAFPKGTSGPNMEFMKSAWKKYPQIDQRVARAREKVVVENITEEQARVMGILDHP